MKSKTLFITKIVIAAVLINLLIACTDANGNNVSWVHWMFAPDASGGSGNAGAFLTSVGQALGGPWGYALAGVGASATPIYKWFKHEKSAAGLVQATQEARAALDPKARKVFDDTAREFMNNATSGNLRAYVRSKKVKLKRAGKLALERLSDKHNLEKIAKKTVGDVLKE